MHGWQKKKITKKRRKKKCIPALTYDQKPETFLKCKCRFSLSLDTVVWMSLPSEPVKHPVKLKPLNNMAQKLETMELHTLHPLGSTNLLPPVPATTPTICLSVPTTNHQLSHGNSPHHREVGLITGPGLNNELGGLSNAGYVSDGSATPLNHLESGLSGSMLWFSCFSKLF